MSAVNVAVIPVFMTIYAKALARWEKRVTEIEKKQQKAKTRKALRK